MSNIIINPYLVQASSAYDADAQAFFDAVETASSSLTDTEKAATNTLVVDLKAASLWSKFKAIYPIVGGTDQTTSEDAHQFNLIDPQDTDAAFRLTFGGSITHASTGMQGNPNGYGNTHFIPSTDLDSVDSSFYGTYLRDNTTGTRIDMGSYTPGTGQYVRMWPTYSGTYAFINGTHSAGATAGPVSDTLGLISMSREDNTTFTAYRNNVALINPNLSLYSGGVSARDVFLLAENSGAGAGSLYSNREQAFTAFGEGLTAAEVSTLYTIVQAYQTTLGRNV